MKWQWFQGGLTMFWVSVILIIILILAFTLTYIIDPISGFCMIPQNTNSTSIKRISENYVEKYGIKIDKPIVYRFVKYVNEDLIKSSTSDDTEEILLGTFHEWNGKYYINITIELYGMTSLTAVVIHETRHMMVQYLKEKGVVDLSEYTEDIASEKNYHYNTLFDNGVYLLKKMEEE